MLVLLGLPLLRGKRDREREEHHDPNPQSASSSLQFHGFLVNVIGALNAASCACVSHYVSSRLRVSGIQIHMIAASRNAAPVIVNAAPKPRVAATDPMEYGAAALAMRPKL